MPIIGFYGCERPDLFAIERAAMDRPGRLIAKLREILPSRGALLDIGAGNGFTAERLSDTQDGPIVAMEPARAMIDQHRKIPWVRGDAEALPFADNRFAGAYATWAYFFPGSFNIQKGVEEAERVVRPGGILAIANNLGDDEFCALSPRNIVEPRSAFEDLGFKTEIIDTVFEFRTIEDAVELLIKWKEHHKEVRPMSYTHRVPHIALTMTILCVVAMMANCSLGRRKSSAERIITAEMVRIPAGEFVMGRDEEEPADHSPAHTVYIDAFYLDKYEVTNAQYLEYCVQTDARRPEFWGIEEFRSGPDFPNHPVVGISWREARQYAEWAGKRLPTEAEWEYAACGGKVGTKYPTGDKLEPTTANYWLWPDLRSSGNGLMPAGSYPPAGYGLHDMAGNAVEWVADIYDAHYYEQSSSENPTGPEDGKFRVIRGGGWHSGPGCTTVYFRNALPENWRDFNVGFRCARSVE